MRIRTRSFRGPLLVAAFVIGAGAHPALAQELQVDAPALDAKSLDGAGSVQTRRKGKKASAAQQAPQAAGKAGGQQGGRTPDRQFGELEGWSPGKAPPNPKDKDAAPSGGSKTSGPPIGMSPSGNMSVGLPF